MDKCRRSYFFSEKFLVLKEIRKIEFSHSSNTQVHDFNRYDATPSDYISMIITDYGMVSVFHKFDLNLSSLGFHMEY